MPHPQDDLNRSILRSLDGDDPRLLPYIPELLQDLTGLGANPEEIERILVAHASLRDGARVLDLGCGKGTVSLHLLAKHDWRAVGVDGLPAFVACAIERSRVLGLSDRCSFHVADMRTWTSDSGFDVVILGAIGPVLGTTEQTLTHVATFLEPGGVVVLDECYVYEEKPCRNAAYRSRAAVLASVARSGFRVLAEAHADEAAQKVENDGMFEAIRQRANALAQRHPELREVFGAYVAAQSREFEVLETEVENVTLLVAPDAVPR